MHEWGRGSRFVLGTVLSMTLGGPAKAGWKLLPAGHPVRLACREDCQEIKPKCESSSGSSKSEIKSCIREHKDEISKDCRQALRDHRTSNHPALPPVGGPVKEREQAKLQKRAARTPMTARKVTTTTDASSRHYPP